MFTLMPRSKVVVESRFFPLYCLLSIPAALSLEDARTAVDECHEMDDSIKSSCQVGLGFLFNSGQWPVRQRTIFRVKQLLALSVAPDGESQMEGLVYLL
jgi:hypothetical protein